MTKSKQPAVAFVKFKWLNRFNQEGQCIRDPLKPTQYCTQNKMFTGPTEQRLAEWIKYYCEHNGILYAETITPVEYRDDQGVNYESIPQV